MIHDEEPPRLPGPDDRVVFAEDFHGLFHPWWSRECDNRRLHLSRAWEYKWSLELRAATLCRIGRHQLVKSWTRDRDGANRGVGELRFAWTCYACLKRPPL